MLYPIVEKFISINGEGAHAGELAAFIRFKGCNLRCPYCDTKWAYDNNAAAEMLSAEQLCSFAQGIVNVTLTGGEPLLQDIGTLTDLLIENGHRVEIETNGSISIEQLALRKRRPFF
ncbi:MAG: radical SAM protein, partial [Clostridia bacterium]|nr:radical SAM protein [Clostridia bacterium]